MITVISDYFESVLTPQLRKLQVSEEFQSNIRSVVEKQMTSAIYNWQYDDVRRIFMLLTAEEAHFYYPAAPEEVKAFVVLTIRNSPIESLQSDVYSITGLSQKISERQLKEITSEAIQFFKNYQIEELYGDGELPARDDYYGQLLDKYIIATRALDQLASSDEQECSFSSYSRADADDILHPFLLQEESIYHGGHAVVDGYDQTVDQTLFKQLDGIARDKAVFFADSFKMISRNAEKLFAILEYLLAHDATLLTSNYLLMHTYVEKRVPILKAASSRNTSAEIQMHLGDDTGLLPLHKKCCLMFVFNYRTRPFPLIQEEQDG